MGEEHPGKQGTGAVDQAVSGTIRIEPGNRLLRGTGVAVTSSSPNNLEASTRSRDICPRCPAIITGCRRAE
jgi:hypothetical protein